MLTLEARKLVDQANKKHPNRDDSDYGFIAQGREYFKLGINAYSAKYPDDTWVGSFRLLGWHLEKLGVPTKPHLPVPSPIEIGGRCLLHNVEHQIYAFGDGMLLLSPTDRNYVYHDTLATYEDVTDITPRPR